jgi:hypothetical protein
LGVQPTDLAFHTPGNFEDAGDQFPFDRENLERLEQLSGAEPILDLLIWSEQGGHDPAWEIHTEFVDAKDIHGARYAFFQFPNDLIVQLPEQSQFELVKELFSALNRLGRLDYGFATTMDFAEMPWLYFRGYSLPKLSRDLKLNLALWHRQIREYKKKVRGVYWVNVLGAGHLAALNDRQGFERRLADLIGRESLSTFGQTDLCFRVPSTGTDPNPHVIAVQNHMMEHDLLMLPSVADIPVVLDDSFHRVRPAI